jgi:DNA-binding CsgD family transcriptional regulator
MRRDPTTRRLTERERQIAFLLADGLKPVVIARRLGLSLTAVKLHVQRAQWRLDLPDRDALVLWVQGHRTPGSPDVQRCALRSSSCAAISPFAVIDQTIGPESASSA